MRTPAYLVKEKLMKLNLFVMIGFTHGILLVFKNSSRASRLPRVDACEAILEQWILCIDCNSYLNEDAKRF